MICTTCENRGIIWVKVQGNTAIGRCACPEGQRDQRRYPTLSPSQIKNLAGKEEAFQKSLKDDVKLPDDDVVPF